MMINKKQTVSAPSREPNATKPMQVATASVSLPHPSKPQRADPSHAEIAEKAYGIWFSLGQVLGRDQEIWFEAEQQLRQA